jgi:hypothetical protein
MDSCRVLRAKRQKRMYRDNRRGLLRGSGHLLHLAVSKVTGLFHFLEIVEVVNFDSVNLLNLAREDLWSSRFHVKKTRRTFILVYINHHTGVTLDQL